MQQQVAPIGLPLAIAAPTIMLVRVIVIVVGLGLWFFTQKLLARRNPCSAAGVAASAGIFDGIHHLTRGINRRLILNARAANILLMSSSLVIDLLGAYLLISSVIGQTFQPFLGLLMLFALRQICQAFCPLPVPEGMIWRSPGFPTVLVTYGTSTDLFFSGHTAIAVYGAMMLGSSLGVAGIVIGVAIMIFEVATVLVLRAHYTMDVFTGAITALYVFELAAKCAPAVDRWMALLIAR